VITVFGDLHIPKRATEIPESFRNLLRESELILCTGDLATLEVLEELKSYGKLVVVQGNMDSDSLGLSKKEIVEIGDSKLKVALFHGTGVHPRGDAVQLAQIAKDMGVSILISGHTHHLSIHDQEGILLLNPGSATGAWGGSSSGAEPTMMTLRIEEKKIYIGRVELQSTSGEYILKEYVHELK